MLIPPDRELVDFVSADNVVVAAEDLLNEALAKDAAEKADGSDIDSNDAGPNLQLPVVSAITAVDVHTLRECPWGASFFCNSTQWRLRW